MKLNRKDLRVLIENILLEQSAIDKVKSKIQQVIQKIRKGSASAINPETEEAIEPKQAISELETVQNLVNENPDKRALGTESFKNMSNIGQARNYAADDARGNLARKIKSKSSDGKTVTKMNTAGFKIIHTALVQNQDTGLYTIYIVMEAQ